MATPVDFEGANAVMLGGSNVRDLPVFHKTVEGEPFEFLSAWRLTPEELENVVATGVVWIGVWQTSWHHGPPPIRVSGEALVTVDGRPARAEPVMPLPGKRDAT